MRNLIRKIASTRMPSPRPRSFGPEDHTYLDLVPVLFFILGFVIVLITLAARYVASLLHR